MRQGKPIATPAETCPGRVPRCSGLTVRSARRGTLRGAGEPAGHDATVHGHVLAVPAAHERKTTSATDKLRTPNPNCGR